MKFHPICTMFPPMSSDELKDLTEDILKNGLQVPIRTWNDGTEDWIIDGLHRKGVCDREGVEPRYEPFIGTFEQARAAVISWNTKRRNLSQSQKAMVAASVVTTEPGTNRYTNLDKETSLPRITLKEAAAIFGIDPSLVSRAKTVLDHGTPEEIAACRDGSKGVTAMAKAIRLRTKQSEPKEQSVGKPRGRQSTKIDPNKDTVEQIKKKNQLKKKYHDEDRLNDKKQAKLLRQGLMKDFSSGIGLLSEVAAKDMIEIISESPKKPELKTSISKLIVKLKDIEHAL